MCPLPNVYWTTVTPVTQDTTGVQQPDLVDDSSPGTEDGNRVLVSHVMALRNKLQNAYQEIGTTPGNLPTSSLRYRTASLETRMTSAESKLTVLYPTHGGRHAFGGADAVQLAESQVTDLVTHLGLKANDNAVVHLTGNETVAGIKAFTSSPTGPEPTLSTQLATRNYVDTQVAIVSGTYAAGVQDLPALRAIGAAARQDKQMRLVEDKASIYRFDTAGTGADDNDFIIVPSDITPPAPGRWFRLQSATQDHEGLSGLQGGALNDHKHLTTTELGNVPSTGQKQSLAGSYGVPGTGNEYVTKTDPTYLRGPVTTKGDIYGRDGTGPQRIPVGADGHVLVADSSQGLGVKWASGGSVIPVASPAIASKILELVPAFEIDLDSDTFVVVDNDSGDRAEVEIMFPYQGNYVFLVDLAAIALAGEGFSEVGAAFRIIVDRGTPEAITVAPTNELAWSIVFEDSVNPEYKTITTSPVTLTPGIHKITLEWKRVIGEDVIEINTNHFINIMALNFGASGAGGAVGSSAVLSTQQTISSTSPAVIPSEPVTLTLLTADNEWLWVQFYGLSTGTAARTALMQVYLDGNPIGNPVTFNIGAGDIHSLGDSFPLFIAEPGLHTFEIYAWRATNNWDLAADCTLRVTQFRGGLIPIKQGGGTISQVPKALNFVSGAVVTQDADGQANIVVVGTGGIGATEDPTPFTDMGASAATSAASRTTGVKFVTVKTCQVTGIKFRTAKTGAHTIRARLWRTGTGGVSSVDVACSGPGVYRAIFAAPFVIAAADVGVVFYATVWEASATDYSSYTAILAEDQYGFGKSYLALNRGSSYASGNAIPDSTDGTNSYPVDPIIENNADVAVGSAAADNLPIFSRLSVSEVDLVAAPGVPQTLRATLNDLRQYTAASPLTIDLTVSGLGGLDTGSESSSQWYYAYCVPALLPGSLGAVASVSPPSVGPTGFPIWSYICAFYNNGSGDIVDMVQERASFRFLGQREAVDVVAFGTTLQTPKVEVDISDVCPETASSVEVSQQLQVDGSGTGFIKQELYVEGLSLVINDLIEGGVAAATYAKTRAVVPVPNVPKKIGYLSDVLSGTQALTSQKLLFHGWNDSYLTNRPSKGQGASAVRQMIHVVPPFSSITNVYEVAGSLSFDPTTYAALAAIKFVATGYVSAGTLTGTIRLYNVTDDTMVTDLTFTSTTPGQQISAALVLPNAAKIYEVRIKVAGVGIPTDVFYVQWAGFQIDPM